MTGSEADMRAEECKIYTCRKQAEFCSDIGCGAASHRCSAHAETAAWDPKPLPEHHLHLEAVLLVPPSERLSVSS